MASFTPSQPNPVVFGTSIELNCSSVGRSPFNLSISVGGRVLTSTAGVGRSVPLRYTLEVTDDSNYTTYTCQSENSFGSDNTTVTVVRASELIDTHVIIVHRAFGWTIGLHYSISCHVELQSSPSNPAL